MPVAHAIAVVLLAILAQPPIAAGEGERDRSGRSNPDAHEVWVGMPNALVTHPFPAQPDPQAHDAIAPSPREEADEWRECEENAPSDSAASPGTNPCPSRLPTDQVGPDRPGSRSTGLRACFLLCGRLNC